MSSNMIQYWSNYDAKNNVDNVPTNTDNNPYYKTPYY